MKLSCGANAGGVIPISVPTANTDIVSFSYSLNLNGCINSIAN